MKFVHKALLAGTSTITSIFMVAEAAHAQAVVDEQLNPQAEQNESQSGVNDIIVTATKRATLVQDVPLSISAVGGDDLFDRGVQSFAELSRLVPGISQSGSSQFTKFTIRGIQTSNTTSSGGEQKPVAVYLNDLPLTSFSIVTPEISPFDMNRIEVLRGPQGTLFGSGTLAGAVRYVTNKPDATGFDASAKLDVGLTKSDSIRRRIAAVVNVPLVQDKLALRVVGYGRKDDGYVDNITLDKENVDTLKAWGGRVAVRWNPTERLTIDGMVTYDRNKLADTNRYTPSLGTNIARSRIPFSTDVDQKTYNITGAFDLDWASVESSTTYADVSTNWSLDINSVTAFPYYLAEPIKTKSFVEDFRVVSPGGKLIDYVVGFFFFDQKSNYEDRYFTDGTFLTNRGITGLRDVGDTRNVFDYQVRIRKNFEAAIYGEGTVNFTDSLSGTIGLRQTWYEYSDQNTGAGFSGVASYRSVVAAGGGTVTLLPDPATYVSTGPRTKLTKKFNISWKPGEDQTLYLLAAEGFRRGHTNPQGLTNNGVSIIDPTDPTIIPVSAGPDTLWNYEFGAKLRMWGGRLQANLALFYIDWSPMQVALVRQSDTFPFVNNIGKSVTKGMELELRARPFQSLELGANLTVQSAKVKKLTAQDSLLSGAEVGSRLASPNFQYYIFAKKSFELANGNSLFGRFDIQHVGSYPTGFPNVPGANRPSPSFFTVPSYTNVDASVGYESTKLDVSFYVENLFNNDDPIFINASACCSNRYVTLRPRTFGVRADWKY